MRNNVLLSLRHMHRCICHLNISCLRHTIGLRLLLRLLLRCRCCLRSNRLLLRRPSSQLPLHRKLLLLQQQGGIHAAPKARHAQRRARLLPAVRTQLGCCRQHAPHRGRRRQRAGVQQGLAAQQGLRKGL